MYPKKILKKEDNISIEKIISLVWLFKIVERLFIGRKPPEEINVIDKLNEINDLKSKKFKIIKIKNVNNKYIINILKYCFIVSVLSKEKKWDKDFLRLLSNISINKTIEKRKYKPPIHWDVDLHNIKLSSKCLIFSKIVNPVDVKPDTASKYASKKEIL